MTTNKQNVLDQLAVDRKLIDLGFSQDECNMLRKISRTLQRWGERKCNENIYIQDGKTYKRTYSCTPTVTHIWRVRNLEKGALKRLAEIQAQHQDVSLYHQMDPRGAAIYALATAHIPVSDRKSVWINAHYTFGVAIY